MRSNEAFAYSRSTGYFCSVTASTVRIDASNDKYKTKDKTRIMCPPVPSSALAFPASSSLALVCSAGGDGRENRLSPVASGSQRLSKQDRGHNYVRVHTSAGIGMSPTNTYVVPLAMLALALMLIAAALWL